MSVPPLPCSSKSCCCGPGQGEVGVKGEPGPSHLPAGSIDRGLAVAGDQEPGIKSESMTFGPRTLLTCCSHKLGALERGWK